VCVRQNGLTIIDVTVSLYITKHQKVAASVR